MVALALPIIIFLLSCNDEVEDQPPVRPVRVVETIKPQHIVAATFNGVTAPVQVTDVSFRVPGLVNKVHVDVGDMVRQGQILAELDQSDYELKMQSLRGQVEQAKKQFEVMKKGERPEQINILKSQVASAKSSLDTVRKDYERYEELLGHGIVSSAQVEGKKSAMDNARSNLLVAEQQLEQAQQGARPEDLEIQEALIASFKAELKASENSIKYTKLLAPFNSNISSIDIEAHMQVQAMQPVMSLQDLDVLEVSVGIPEDGYIYRDFIESATVSVTALKDAEFPARIHSFGVTLDASNSTYPVTVRFDNVPHKALSGMSAQVAFNVNISDIANASSVVVPLSAIAEEGKDRRFIWVVENDIVKKRYVKLGQSTASGVFVSEGLTHGEIVVTAGANHLFEGQKIRTLGR